MARIERMDATQASTHMKRKRFAAITASPTSPENSKVVSYLNANAPSPRTLPRALSRSSDDMERRGLIFPFASPSSEHLDLNSASSQVPTKKPDDWVWEYCLENVGAYDIPSRRERINRYRQKRKQLIFHKVRYSARSNICQKRERIGGRFVKTDRIIRADKAALMYPNAALRSPKQKDQYDKNDLNSVAELMVGLSKRLAPL